MTVLANQIKFRWKDADGTMHYEVLELDDTYDIISIEAYEGGIG